MSKRLIIAGGSGFIGHALIEDFVAQGYEIVILTRSSTRAAKQAQHVVWDGKTLGEWVRQLDGAEAVINLAGKSVNCRYTPSNRQEIIGSRVDSVNVIGQAIVGCRKPPSVWVQASSLAIYGDTGERICNENASLGKGFPVVTCVLWERAFNSILLPNTRKILLRLWPKIT